MVSEERIKTNLLLMDKLDMWGEFTIKAINDEWTLRYYNHIMNLLNSQVDEAIKWLESDDAKELFFEEAEYQYGLFQSLEDEWDSILERRYDSIEALLDEVYRRGKAKGYAEMRQHVRFSDSDKLALNFVTGYNFGLIQRIDNDTRHHIKNLIIRSAISGENPRKVAPKIMDTVGTRLTGSTFSPMQRAVMIARTEVSRAQNTGILQSYVNEGYTEVKILTAEDSNVCYTCLSYAYEFNDDNVIFANHGEEKVHNIIELIKGGLFPPFHPNCRCTYLSVWETKGTTPKNPEVISLFPSNFKSKEDLERLKDSKDWSKLKGIDIPDYFDDDLKKAMKKFDSYHKKFEDGNEWAMVFNRDKGKFEILTNEFKPRNLYTDGKQRSVNPLNQKNFGEDELILLHNHQDGSFLSLADFGMGFFRPENIKCVIVHTHKYIFIANINKIPSSIEEFDKFAEEYWNIRSSYNNPLDWYKFNRKDFTKQFISVDVVVKNG